MPIKFAVGIRTPLISPGRVESWDSGPLTTYQVDELEYANQIRRRNPDPFDLAWPRRVLGYLPGADVAAIDASVGSAIGASFRVHLPDDLNKQSSQEIRDRLLKDGLSVVANGPAFDAQDRPQAFRADAVKLAKLLTGASLYGVPDVGLRELVQNAYDACIRKQNRKLSGYVPKITLRIDPSGQYFDVEDNGPGMNRDSLLNEFFVIGASANHTFLENHQLNTIGMFGIGFISCFAIAERIVVSTKALDGGDVYNFSMTSITEVAHHTPESECDRTTTDSGTTVRVYLKDKYARTKSFAIDKLRQHCRHVRFLFLVHDGEEVRFEQKWLYRPGAFVMLEEPGRYKAIFSWANLNDTRPIKVCSGGILVCEWDSRFNMFGEIDVEPQQLTLTMARDGFVDDDKSQILDEVSSLGLKKLLVETRSVLSSDRASTIVSVVDAKRIREANERLCGKEPSDIEIQAVEDNIAISALIEQEQHSHFWASGRPADVYYYLEAESEPLHKVMRQSIRRSGLPLLMLGHSTEDAERIQRRRAAIEAYCLRQGVRFLSIVEDFPAQLLLPSVSLSGLSKHQTRVVRELGRLLRKNADAQGGLMIVATEENLGEMLVCIGNRCYLALCAPEFPTPKVSGRELKVRLQVAIERMPVLVGGRSTTDTGVLQ